MEQFVRDARIAMIYEGANGVQALDLVGRKLAGDGGRALMAFFNEVGGFLKENAERRGAEAFARAARSRARPSPAGHDVVHAERLAKPDNAGAGAYDYMHLFGLVALGYMWAQMAKVALASRRPANGAAERMDAKLTTARFFMERMLPETRRRIWRGSPGAVPTTLSWTAAARHGRA